MSRGNQPGVFNIFTGLAMLFASLYSIAPAVAGETAYFYCRRVQGNPYTDFALAVTGDQLTLQPHASPESPGVRIYHGKAVRQYPSGNILVDLDTDSRLKFLSPYPNMLVTPSIFNKGNSGYARMYNGAGVDAKDSVLSCEIKKIFI